MIENSIEVTNETKKISFISSTPYKVGQKYDIKENNST